MPFKLEGETWTEIGRHFIQRPVYSFNTYITPRWVFVLVRRIRYWNWKG